MNEIIGNLKNRIILNDKIILDLKKYIYSKNQGLSSKELSIILADAIHRIIDNSMGKFNEELKYEIERKLLREAVSNNDFSINAYKIFCEYCISNLEYDRKIDQLYEWISSNQDEPVEKNELINFISKLKKLENTTIDEQVKNVSQAKESIEGTTLKINYSNLLEAANNTNGINIREIQILKDLISNFMTGISNKYKVFGRRGILLTASLAVTLLIILCGKGMGYTYKNLVGSVKINSTPEASKDIVLVSKTEGEDNGLPSELKYIEVDKEILRNWLLNRNSILAEEPYLTAIMNAAKEYDINPLFLIAITGQEQGFVPKTNQNALKIANNPFNVYESWASYNTTIKDSSRIAARTIINLSKDRPENVHAIQWINNKYAEDKNWWVGVDKIFTRLVKEITQ